MKANRHTRELRPMAESGRGDARLARGARLLGAYGALPESPGRMNRVRRSVQSAPEPARAGWIRIADLRDWLPRPAVALALLLGLTAVAGATVGRAPLSRAFDEVQRRLGLAPSAPSAPEPRPVAATATARDPGSAHVASIDAPRPSRSVPAAVEPSAVAASAVAPVAPAAPATIAASSPSAPIAAHGPHRESGAHSSAAPPAVPAAAKPAVPAAEASLVHAAMRALRVEGDPARASALLESYLKRYPEGALVEETLSLWIEALSRQDPARAALVAATYRRKFPTGPRIDKANAAIAAAPR